MISNLKQVEFKEEWKTIPTNKKYEVSNYGVVRNKDGGNILKPYYTNGYAKIKIGNTHYSISRLVAALFLGLDIYADDLRVHHRNRVKRDNRFTNLEVLTESEHKDLHAKYNKANTIALKNGAMNLQKIKKCLSKRKEKKENEL